MGDPRRLRQVLFNLIGNAVKFTDQGTISVELREGESANGCPVLEFTVTDTGMGIPADIRPSLFTPFSQADSATIRQDGGTGLGLSIVRVLTERMGGTAGFDSVVGQGSRFWFRVPAERAAARSKTFDAAAAIIAAQSPTTVPHRLLIVEDNPTNIAVLSAMLKRLGVDFAVAQNGQEALDRVTSGEVPDLVLMDCQMPVMDGFVATQRIRQWERENGRTRLPIIAVTAAAFAEDRNRCLAAGMDDFLTKPLALSDLKVIFAKWLANDQTTA